MREIEHHLDAMQEGLERAIGDCERAPLPGALIDQPEEQPTPSRQIAAGETVRPDLQPVGEFDLGPVAGPTPAEDFDQPPPVEGQVVLAAAHGLTADSPVELVAAATELLVEVSRDNKDRSEPDRTDPAGN